MLPSRILVADDQSAVRESLRLLFTTEGYQVGMDDSPAKVLDGIAKEDEAHVILSRNRGITAECWRLREPSSNSSPRHGKISVLNLRTIFCAARAKDWAQRQLTPNR
jgi:DNA-binding NtrC family response regulator